MQKIIEKLGLSRKDGIIVALVFAVLGVSFSIFNALSVVTARAWDIEWGYYAILLTFVVMLVGFVFNAKDFIRRLRNHLPSKWSLIALSALLVFFSVFAVNHIGNTHRVLSDETSWESMGLQMYFAHTGGICNEGLWEGDLLDCKTEVNNFKGKALGFIYSLIFQIAEPGRDTALAVNFPLFLLSLVAFFLALSIWFKNEWLALAATAFLGGMPIYLLQSRSASTEVLYIALLTLLMAWYALVPSKNVHWKHFLVVVPLLGFFAQTRQETVFAFIPFALFYWRYFREAFYRLPLFILSVIAVSWPSINTMAAYRGYDFQGGEHAAHSIDNFIFNVKSNINVMLNFDPDPAFGGVLKNPFYSTFTILLLFSTAWLLLRLIVNRRYVRGAILGFFFSLQIFVILFNVSGTFEIDINQRYVLVALPLFAMIMALGLKDFLDTVVFPGKQDKACYITVGVAVLLSVGLAIYHVKSFDSNMLYYKNKLLVEEDYLNTHLASFPQKSIFIYARPWQMLASRHSSFSERTFMNWTTDDFARWMQWSNGNIYLVRGQDGYGNVDRTSRVVGFKTTDQIETILEGYKLKRILQENRLFGYPLTVHQILAKKGVSVFAQNLSIGEVVNGTVEVSKLFENTIAYDVFLNDSLWGHDSLAKPLDTLSLTGAKVGLQRVKFAFYTPDAETVYVFRDFFKEDPSVALLTSLPLASKTQAWGEPQIGKSVEQHVMKLDGEPFSYGFGSHASSNLAFDMPPHFGTFHATIGLDDESACGDGVEFSVVGDGRELFRSKRLYSRDRENIAVPVAGVKRLELIAIEGENKDCDHADWANAWFSAGAI